MLQDSDSAIKQILLTMNEKRSFIIEDLDDQHVVIKADEEYRVRKELEVEVRLTSDYWVGHSNTLYAAGEEHI